MKNADDVENCNFISVVKFVVIKRLNNCCSKKEIKDATFEELKDQDPKK